MITGRVSCSPCVVITAARGNPFPIVLAVVTKKVKTFQKKCLNAKPVQQKHLCLIQLHDESLLNLQKII